MIEDLGIVFAAGGSSSRYGHGNKLFEIYQGEPLFIRTIRHLAVPLCPPRQAILVAAAAELAQYRELLKTFLPDYPLQLTTGGVTRTASVINGLACLGPEVRYAAIHDAARPQATPAMLERVLWAAREVGGAIPGKPVTDTVKKVNAAGLITATVDRSELWRVETPQIFELNRLREAYRQAEAAGLSLTDDAAIMEFAGFPVKMVHLPESNLKITYPEDLKLLESLSR